MRSPRHSRTLTTVALFLGLTAPVVLGQDAPPRYGLQFLGPGSPAAINNTGIVVGARLSGTNYQPLVSRNGTPWVALPVLPGTTSCFPTDINDSGVIVGVSYSPTATVAVRWLPAGADVYSVQEIPRLAGDSSSYATAINNLGQIVGARGALGYQPAATTGWLYSDSLGVVNLLASYGLATVPRDINDNGLLITSNERLNLVTGVHEDVGAPPPTGYNRPANVAINDAGMIAGAASLSSISLNVVSVFRFDGQSTWKFIAGSSRYTVATSINALGDVGYGEQGAGIYLEGFGTYPLWTLVDPQVQQAGWSITGNGLKIDDHRVIATTARNSVTGESGGVLLTQNGASQPPPAPVLSGVPHPYDPYAPWTAISLTWTASPRADRYIVERKGPSDANFVRTWDTIQLLHDDLAIQPGVTYTYRVFAENLIGRSAASNEVTVVAPAAADTVAPVVTIVTPARNARVLGIVPVVARATDNVGVARMEIVSPAGAVLKTVTGSQLTYDWNLSRARRGSTQTLVVWAYDAAGNAGRGEVVVRIR